MADAKPGVHNVQLRLPTVQQFLVDGIKCVKYDEEASNVPVVSIIVLSIDPKGYVLFWRDTVRKEIEVVDLLHIRDIRFNKHAKSPKDVKVRELCCNFGEKSADVEEKLLSIVCGCDFVTMSFINFCGQNKQTMQLLCDTLYECTFNQLLCNSNCVTLYERLWTKIYYVHEEDGKIPLQAIYKHIALHRDDRKRIDRTLKNAGMDTEEKNGQSHILTTQFTFELFMEFLIALTERGEMISVFKEISGGVKAIDVDRFTNFLNRQRDPRLNEILYPYYDTQRALKLINRHENSEQLKQNGCLSRDGLTRYLLSEHNNIFSADKLDLSQNMSQPLSHYFINSSHNTYLTGHQLTGKASADMYRQVLLSGCRCVELDCWDGEDNEPSITHGYTMVNHIPLRECLEAIADTAFRTSSMPIILSIENHCSPKQQSVIASHLKRYLGKWLLTELLPQYPLEPGSPLPPPDALQFKILVKNKKKEMKGKFGNQKSVDELSLKSTASGVACLTERKQSSANLIERKPEDNIAEIEDDDDSSSDVFDTTATPAESSSTTTSDIEVDVQSRKSSAPEILPSTSKFSTNSREVSVDATAAAACARFSSCRTRSSIAEIALGMGEMAMLLSKINASGAEARRASLKKPERRKSIKIGVRRRASYASTLLSRTHSIKDAKKEVDAIVELSELVNYVQPSHFVSFEASEQQRKYYEIFSFAEAAALNALKIFPVEFVQHNKRQLSRIYPKGTRVDSGNFLPQMFWNAGCQLVALNFQTLDLGMQLQLGCFEYNARCGFLLKPDFMRREDKHFNPFLEDTHDGIIAGTITVRIISGQFLSTKRIGSYIEVEMYGLPSDTVRKKHRTKVVPNNSINPSYNDEIFVFQKVVLPEMADLRFVVMEETGKLIGHRIICANSIRPGYRHITLKNEANQLLPLASIFVHITVSDYVHELHKELADALANPIQYQSDIDKRSEQLAIFTDDSETSSLTGEIELQIGGNSSTSSAPLSIKPAAPTSAGQIVTSPTFSEGLFRKELFPATNFKSSSSSFNLLVPILPMMAPPTPPTVTRGGILNEMFKQRTSTPCVTPLYKSSRGGSSGILGLIASGRKSSMPEIVVKDRKERSSSISAASSGTQTLLPTKLTELLPSMEMNELTEQKKIERLINKRDKEVQQCEKRLAKLEAKTNADERATSCRVLIEDKRNIQLKYCELIANEMRDSLKQFFEKQMRRIEQTCQTEQTVLKKVLSVQNVSDMKKLSKTFAKDADALESARKEAKEKHIKLAVSELEKLANLSERVTTSLRERFESVERSIVEQEKNDEFAINNEYEEMCASAQSRFRLTSCLPPIERQPIDQQSMTIP